jgi:cytochrome c oxidase subunit 3
LCISFQYNPSEHLSFELCSWYWHFVDIVWLVLYVSIYLCNGLLSI